MLLGYVFSQTALPDVGLVALWTFKWPFIRVRGQVPGHAVPCDELTAQPAYT